jgi:hypothetical protein
LKRECKCSHFLVDKRDADFLKRTFFYYLLFKKTKMASRKQKQEEPVYIVDNTVPIPMPPIPDPDPAKRRQQEADFNAAVRPASPVPKAANAAAAPAAADEMERSDSGYHFSASSGWPEHFRPVTAVDRSKQPPREEPQDPNAPPALLK